MGNNFVHAVAEDFMIADMAAGWFRFEFMPKKPMMKSTSTHSADRRSIFSRRSDRS